LLRVSVSTIIATAMIGSFIGLIISIIAKSWSKRDDDARVSSADSSATALRSAVPRLVAPTLREAHEPSLVQMTDHMVYVGGALDCWSPRSSSKVKTPQFPLCGQVRTGGRRSIGRASRHWYR
jgi:hypothetical protein